MSIATLKKKTQAKYNNLSVNSPQFSLQGTHRNQGYVGQTSLTRSLPKTIAQGTTAKGHGGCCGTYVKKNPILSAVKTTENSSVIKRSVMSTFGLLSTKYRWIKRPQPYATVKPDTNHSLQNSSDYTEYLKKKSIQSADLSNCGVFVYQSTKCAYTTKQEESQIVALSQGDYIIKLHKQCADYEVSFVRHTNNSNGIPFSCGKS